MVLILSGFKKTWSALKNHYFLKLKKSQIEFFNHNPNYQKMKEIDRKN
jgi:hypothetical protein